MENHFEEHLQFMKSQIIIRPSDGYEKLFEQS